MSAQFTPDENEGLAELGQFEMTAFGLNLSPNSQLCPENNCQYSFEDGQLRTSSGGYHLSGILKVSTQAAGGISSKVYDANGFLDQIETFEESGKSD